MDTKLTSDFDRHHQFRRGKSLGVILLNIFCCLTLFVQSLRASTLVVTSLADSGPGTLREQLALAAPGDTIKFDVNGTIFLESPLFVSKDVNIEGPGKDKLSIDGQKSTLLLSITNAAVQISDITWTNAYNAVFSPESLGGAIQNYGDLTMIRCVVAEGTSEFGVGGGIGSYGNLKLLQCSIFDNWAVLGGGIAHLGEGRLTIDRSTIYRNLAVEPGGSAGGGIFKSAGIGILTNVTISGNTALDGNGGGIEMPQGYLLVESCTIVSNVAETSRLSNRGRGGGISTGGRVEMRNTILAGNRADNSLHPLAPPSVRFIGTDMVGLLFSQGWNLIQNPTNITIAGVLTGNIIGADPKLGPLQDNGGLTPTHALLSDSPAIDSGSPNDFPHIDQRGVARPQDGNGDNIFITDIGAYERKSVVPGTIPGDHIVTSLADDGPGSLRKVLKEAPPGTKVTFAVEGTIVLDSPIVIKKNVEVAGPGRDKVIIDGENSTLLLTVTNKVKASIADLTFTDGYNTGLGTEIHGGAVQNYGNLSMIRCVVSESISEFGLGGGIWNGGNLTLRQCSISNNLASNGGGIADQDDGRLILDRSTVNGNRAIIPEGSAGGGIFKTAGLAMMTNSTISGNLAFDGSGGGIFNNTYILLESCTIVSNTAVTDFHANEGRGGGLAMGPHGRTELRNTIIAGNTAINSSVPAAVTSIGPDVFGFLFSQGWNLIQDSSDAIIAGVLTGNLHGLDPLLGPLQDNGGPTWTHALLPGSPALDAANPYVFPSTDQRGVARPQDGDGNGVAISDIGAFERKFGDNNALGAN